MVCFCGPSKPSLEPQGPADIRTLYGLLQAPAVSWYADPVAPCGFLFVGN